MSILRVFAIITTVLLFQCGICVSLRILGVFPLPGRSHFVMSGKLMTELAQRGHKVDVISPFPRKKPLENYRDIFVEAKDKRTAVNNVSYNETKNFNSFSMSYFVKMAGTAVCELLEHPNMQEVIKTKKGAYDVIIVELFVAHCYLAFGQHLNAPVVGTVTSKMHDWLFEPFANPLNPSYMPSLFSSFGQHMTFWERLQNTFFTTVITPQMNYYMEEESKFVEKHFGRKLSSIKELYDDVSMLLVNAHHSLNDIKPTTPDIIEVGGLHVVDDEQELTADLKKWLDDSTDGCVYFTFGSMVKIESFPDKMVKAFYETFERIAPVRVLMKIADPTALLPGLPKNVKISPWLPQVAILKHKNIKLFITHGGLMGTQEAIAHKVPMVGLPIYGDQHTNIQTYANKKIAIALKLDETLTADSLTNAVKTVLNDPIYRNNIERISRLFMDRPMSALDTAVYWVEYTARHGTVLKSPATQLTWWQFYLLDVYGFILLCVLIVLYIIKRVSIFSWRLVCPRKIDESSESLLRSKKNK